MLSSRTVLAACALACAGTAAQALPTATLSFAEAAGTVGATDSIEVWLRLTIDGPLTIDNTAGAPFGLDEADLPVQGYDGDSNFVPFATITRVWTNTAFGCGSDFVASPANSCGGGAYNFEFHTDNSDPTKPSFNFLEALSLSAGSHDYLFGTFVPVSPVAGATYTFDAAYLTLNFEGYAADGTALTAGYDLAASCAGQTDCAFTRTVVSTIPEPTGYAMLLAGLMGVGATVARRRG